MLNRLNSISLSDDRKEFILRAVYIGSFLIMLALIFYVHPRILNDLVNFFLTMTLSTIPGTSIFLPAPTNPAAHANLYVAAFQFSLAMGFVEIVILAFRVWFHSSVYRKAETIENIVFWLGLGYLIITYLVNMTIPSEWFVFWAGVILVFGLSLVARAFVLLARR